MGERVERLQVLVDNGLLKWTMRANTSSSSMQSEDSDPREDSHHESEHGPSGGEPPVYGMQDTGSTAASSRGSHAGSAPAYYAAESLSASPTPAEPYYILHPSPEDGVPSTTAPPLLPPGYLYPLSNALPQLLPHMSHVALGSTTQFQSTSRRKRKANALQPVVPPPAVPTAALYPQGSVLYPTGAMGDMVVGGAGYTPYDWTVDAGGYFHYDLLSDELPTAAPVVESSAVLTAHEEVEALLSTSNSHADMSDLHDLSDT